MLVESLHRDVYMYRVSATWSYTVILLCSWTVILHFELGTKFAWISVPTLNFVEHLGLLRGWKKNTKLDIICMHQYLICLQEHQATDILVAHEVVWEPKLWGACFWVGCKKWHPHSTLLHAHPIVGWQRPASSRPTVHACKPTCLRYMLSTCP